VSLFDMAGVIGHGLLYALIYPATLLGIALCASAVHWAYEAAGAPFRRPKPPTYDDRFALRARMKRLAKTTLLLVPAKRPGFSKIGGLPNLPDSVPWPRSRVGPAAFVAQLDLEVIRRSDGFDWLPLAGCLFVFFDERNNGARDAARVIYSTDEPAVEAAPPSDLPRGFRFGERRVAFMPFVSFPSSDWLGSDWPDGIDWESWPFADGADFGDEIEHRVGGYPSEIQGGRMALECEALHRGAPPAYEEAAPDDLVRASRQWRLLVQIDSDPGLGMTWADGGRVYIFVRTPDAKKGDFSKIVTLTQTY
jgi:uncharacterized protein YwqG